MTALTWRRVRVPFVREFTTAAGTWSARDSWILVMRDDDGRCGIGESGLEDEARSAAIDAARLDLGGTTTGAPLGAPEGVTEDAPWVGVNATIGALGTHEAVEAVERAVAAGFWTLKLKAAPDETGSSLLERLRAVRAAAGAGIALRLDVNGTWDLAGAVERLRLLDAIGLQYVEQPLPVEAHAAAAELRRQTGVAVAADEAVTSEVSARALLDRGAADVLVVKPGRVGGPTVVAAIAAMAAERGVPVVVSSMFETGVGLAAGLAAAAALPDVPGWPAAERDHGLATVDLLEDDLIVDPLVLDAGRMRAPGGPGSGALGVRLDEAALARYAVTDR
jgi:L-Ala-D/L-Glu epimerase